MTLEGRLRSLEDERQINRLLVRYCELVDSGMADLVSTEFYSETIEADYHFHALHGRKEIHDFYVSGMNSFAETVHAVSNVVIHSCDGEVAEVSSVLIALHWHGETTQAGAELPIDFGLVVRSEDRITRTAEGWRVSKRRARALGPTFALEETPLKLRRKD